MKTDEIRKAFLDFFLSKGHTIVDSDSLVPKDDPTVLFTTAGMQQFKRQFLGHIDGFTRAASSQKCLRTDDLDQVGETDFHHTFFEMLGNFSFGDYFKKEAIAWAWEFFTKICKIPKDKLWVSVYKEDPEAKNIWIKEIGIDAKKVIELGDHDNFWPADAKEKGPNGPCGPCSEIFYDYGKNDKCTNQNCDPSCDCGRFSEVWNLVFTQFNRQEEGILESLPSKNIDTGMGLERLAAVLQDKKSNFETDLFAPIVKAVEKNIHMGKTSLTKKEDYTIADHIRAVVFGISDGVVPSNEGRGYVIKRLIVNCSDICLQSGHNKAVIFKLVPSVIESMRGPYPDVEKKSKDVQDIIKSVEDSYIRVRKEKLPALKEQIKEMSKLSELEQPNHLGRIMFTYRDTHGLTLQTIKSVVEDSNITLPILEKAELEFNRLMEQQQEQSRAKSKMAGEVFTNTELELGLPKTDFIGYNHSQSTSIILKMFVHNKKVDSAKEGEQVKVVLDKTPFYAESGGQIGDTGIILNGKNRLRIEDTQKVDDIYIHYGTIEKGFFSTNDKVQAEIDIERRFAIMRNHTATHLLQAALRDVLGSHVKQQGSLVAADRLRFDFTHPKTISAQQLKDIERRVNEMILSSETVTKEFMDIANAKNSGALAFFAEKYGKVVRVVSVGDTSKEFCGGTHLDATSQIGLFKIIGESAIAQGIRRIEAKTGLGALDFINDQQQQLEDISNTLKTPVAEIAHRIKTQSTRLRAIEKELSKYQFESIKNSVDQILEKSDTLNGTKIVSHSFKDVGIDLLRKISDLLKQKSKSSIIVLGATTEDNASILIAVTDDLIKKGIKANDVILDIAPLINGSGGGRPQLAQAGSKEVSKVDQAILKANSIVKSKLKK